MIAILRVDTIALATVVAATEEMAETVKKRTKSLKRRDKDRRSRSNIWLTTQMFPVDVNGWTFLSDLSSSLG